MQKKTTLIAAALLATLAYSLLFSSRHSVHIPHEIATIFQEWQINHGKKYDRPEELVYRLKTFYSNLNFIKSVNLGQTDFTLALNQFADLAAEEFHSSISIQKEPFEEQHISGVDQLEARDQVQTLNDLPSAVNWDDEITVKYFPPIVTQDPTCQGTSYAWAAQYAVTFNHAYTNKLTPTPISAQKLLDCFFYSKRPFICGESVSTFDIQRALFNNNEIALDQEYSGPKSTIPRPNDKCYTTTIKPTEKRPFVQSQFVQAESEEVLESHLNKGVVVVRIYSNKQIIQFFKSGTISSESCDSGKAEDKAYFTAALVGYNKTIDVATGMKPNWKLRLSYGTNYGVNGNLHITKDNNHSDMIGPCKIYTQTWVPIMKKY